MAQTRKQLCVTYKRHTRKNTENLKIKEWSKM